MPQDVETKLSAARTRLILDKPFLGALVLRLPMKQADPGWCKTTATDARAFYYNHEFIDSLTLDQTQFMLAHEALHCALSHFVRRQHRLKHRWDIACDLAINPLLVRDGLKPPPNSLHMEGFDGMTAEEIYPYTADLEDQEPLDQHLYDENDSGNDSGQGGGKETDGDRAGGSGGDQQTDEPNGGSGGERQSEEDSPGGGQGGPREQPAQPREGGLAAAPKPLSASERDRLEVQWKQRLAGAAQQAMQAGKLGAGWARLVDHLLQPQLPWRMLLARYMSEVARDDYNYSRPSRREGDAIMPSLRSAQVDVVVALDTSGSISNAEVTEFLSEINAIKGQVRARVTLLACDAELDPNAPWVFEPWEAVELPKAIDGGGGTSFIPVFDWVEQQLCRPELVVYFTDAEGRFPAQEPAVPVLWLVKGKARVPFGQRVQLN